MDVQHTSYHQQANLKRRRIRDHRKKQPAHHPSLTSDQWNTTTTVPSLKPEKARAGLTAENGLQPRSQDDSSKKRKILEDLRPAEHSQVEEGYHHISFHFDPVAEPTTKQAAACKDRIKELQTKNQLLQNKIKEFEKRVLCGICYINERDTILVTCGHTFCKACLEAAEKNWNSQIDHELGEVLELDMVTESSGLSPCPSCFANYATSRAKFRFYL